MFEGIRLNIIVFEAEFDNFAHSLHQCIEALCLRVATAQCRNRGHIVAAFVFFNEYRKLPRAIHWFSPSLSLPWRPPVSERLALTLGPKTKRPF